MAIQFAQYAFDDSLLAELKSARIIRTGSLDPARLLYLPLWSKVFTERAPRKFF